MKKSFEEQLKDSLYVHFPLKDEEDRSIEKYNLSKPVLRSQKLWDGVKKDVWTFEGEGECEFTPEGSLRLHTYSRSDHWPEYEVRSVDVSTGYYATFGSYIPKLDVSAFDIGYGNRIHFKVKPTCPGLHSPIVRVGFTNNGEIKIPDQYSREGFNAMNLKNNVWNDCTWEIEGIAHDKLGEISFNFHRYGKEVSTSDDMYFELKDIYIEEVEPNVVLGWQCKSGTAVYSTTGYVLNGKKTAIANTDEDTFEIMSSDGKVVKKGVIEKTSNSYGRFGVIDFSDVIKEGEYCIAFGDYRSTYFEISDRVFESTVWKLINFLFCERCGFPVPEKHGTCHTDVYAEHDGVKLVYNGGWHDAADVSQQTMQSAEIVDAIMSVADAVKDKDRMLYLRMKEEANWTIDFILRMSFGDGYKATHAALRRWTDGLIGNMDDCFADVRNGSFENFVFSAVEAHAHEFFAESDPELAWKCLDSAKHDFDFAVERFESVGVESAHMLEHTSNASRSQYEAVAVWAGARLYKLTKDEKYKTAVEKYARAVVSSQETGGGAPVKGFYYRDESRKAIVHFSHQAREHVFVMGLSEAARYVDSADRTTWENSIRMYGDYLKYLAKYTQPYGMLPAGIYHISEADDIKTFEVVHPKVDFNAERQNYIEQLKNGIDIGNGYFIKAFPVWFSYRGNSAVHLSMGKAASIVGKYFDDSELINIAEEQLYWTLGKNPFGQSIIYGEGEKYGQEYTALLGETVGEMPVGVQTRRNEDLPYWPPACIATYREVWTTPPGRWLAIVADLL